jgi:hypothetical protein
MERTGRLAKYRTMNSAAKIGNTDMTAVKHKDPREHQDQNVGGIIRITQLKDDTAQHDVTSLYDETSREAFVREWDAKVTPTKRASPPVSAAEEASPPPTPCTTSESTSYLTCTFISTSPIELSARVHVRMCKR